MKNELYHKWHEDFAGALTICDAEGIILYMNKKALEIFKDDGGIELIGTNVLNCHTEPSRSQLKRMLIEQSENIYIVEKNGNKELIYQGPWFESGEYCGIIELSIEFPATIKHICR